MVGLVLANSAVHGIAPKKKAKRSSYQLSIGAHYALPTGDLSMSYLAVHGRQGDPSLEGFRHANSWATHTGLTWFRDLGKRRRFAAFAGIERYVRKSYAEGNYTFPDGNTRVTLRAWKTTDIETPIGAAFRTPFLNITAGVRVLWHYRQSDTAYDGDELLEVIGTASDTYKWKDGWCHPFIRVDHEFELGRRLRFGPHVGVERRGWKSERTNWWDFEVGVGLRLL
jgi:hypothetical protein